MFLRKKFLFFHLILLFLSGSVFPQANKVMQSWVSKFNGTDSLSDRGFAIDVRGCIYVTGSSVNDNSPDFTTLKYNPQGELLWSRTFSRSNAGIGVARAIVVDSDCNAYVTGTNEGDFVTIKYDSLGTEQWVAFYNGSANTTSDIAKKIGIDNDENVYVSGFSAEAGTLEDFTTIKYNSNGVQQWVVHVNGTGNGLDIATGMVVDRNGDVAVNGRSQNTAFNYDIVTVKYSASGTLLWQRTISDSLNPGILGTIFARTDRTDPVATDDKGNIYIATTAGGVSNSSEFDYLIAKYSSGGTLKWTSRFNGPGNGFDKPFGIVAENSENVFVTGGSDGGLSGIDFTTIRFDKTGTVKWIQRYDGPGSGTDISNTIAIDNTGAVYISGQSAGITSDDYSTIKYKSNGDLDWLIRYNGEADGPDIPVGIGLDSDENIYVTGFSQTSSTGLDITTIKYDQKLPPKLAQVTDDMRTIAIGLLGVSGNPVIKNLVYQNLTLGTIDIESDTLKYYFISVPNLIQQASMSGIDLKDSINRVINLVNNTNPNRDNVTKILNGITFNGNMLFPHIFIPFFDSFGLTELAQNPFLGYGFMEQDYPLNGFSGLIGNAPVEKLLVKSDVTGNPSWFVFPIIPAACFINGNICPIILTECFVANFACAACNSTFPVGGIPTPANFPQLCGNLQNHEFKLMLNTDNCIDALLWNATLPVQNYSLLSSLQGFDFWTLSGNNPEYARKVTLPIRKYYYQGSIFHKSGTMLTLCDNCNEFHSYPSQDNFGVTGALALGGVFKLSRIGQKSLYFVLPFTRGLWYNGSLDALFYYGTIPLSGTCFAGIQKIREDYLYSTSNQHLSNSLGFNTTDFLASTDLNAISGFWLDNVISVGFTQSPSQFADPGNVVVFNAPFSSASATDTLLQELRLDGNGYMINRNFSSFIAPNTILKIQVDATFKNGEIISGFQTITIQGTQQIGTAVADIRGQIENFNPNILNYHIRIFQ